MRRGTWMNLARLLVGAATLALLVFAASTVLSLVRPGSQPGARQLEESTVRLERPAEALPEVIGWHDPSSTWSASLSFQRAGHRAASQLLRYRAVEINKHAFLPSELR